MKYFENCNTIEELKKEYKKLAFANHPDRGGDVEVMKAINTEYEEKMEYLKKYGSKKDQASTEIPKEFMEAISKIINLEGINIDIMGEWIWVSGNTYPHRETLKNSGCYYGSKKKMWYFKPSNYVRKGGREMSISEIENKYGKVSVKSGAKKEGFKPQLNQ